MPYRFALLTFRPFSLDFERFLMEAVQDNGHESVHVYLQRGDIEIRSGAKFDEIVRVRSPLDAAKVLRTFFGTEIGVILNSAGNSGPDMILQIRLALFNSIWIYDVYDWLLYDAKGAKRLRWWLTDRLYRAIARRCCVRSPDLLKTYPRSFRLENASHIVPLASQRPASFDNRVVVTASYDRRTDFELLSAFAEKAPHITIDMYGLIYDGDSETSDAMTNLIRDHENIRYHGGFELQDLQAILNQYSVGLLPYRIDHKMTQYIRPNKLFDYLCAGIEVIATPLPAVRDFASYVHVVADAEAIVEAINRIANQGERRNPGDCSTKLNWHHRAQELDEVMSRYVA
jgi:hypothetical protein